MKFQTATEADIPQLCQLLKTLFEQEVEFVADREVQTRGLEAILSDPKMGHIIVAKVSDEIVGMVGILYTISTALGARVGLVEDMVISEGYRGQGIGSELLSYTIEFAREHGCRRLTLLTDGDNEVAHSFYKKAGFKPSTMVPFRLSLDD